MELGNFNLYKNASILVAKSPLELVELISKQRVPIKILGFDNDGNNYWVYVNSDRKIRSK